MMVRILKAQAVIEGKDNTSRAFRTAARNAEMMAKRMSAVNAALRGQRLLMSAGAKIAGAAVAGIGAKQSITRFAETERAMTRVGITGEGTAEQVAAATQSLRQLAFDTAQPFDKIVAGMNALVSAGMNFESAMKTIPAIAKVAQATGSDMSETATTADAAMQHMAISAGGMDKAFDSLAAAGKAGKFEFKDMARYLPSLLPAAKAIGYTGQEGLERVAALLQTIRAGTGTSEEAATALSNIFQKMESEETAKKFSKMGVNLRKEMDLARAKGEDLVQTFLRLTEKALKGDMSKLPQLIGDLQFGTGIRSALQLIDKYKEVRTTMKGAAGSIDKDFKRVLGDTQTQIDQSKESIDRLTSSVGRLLGVSFNQSGLPNVIKRIADAADRKSNEVARHGVKALVTPLGELDRTAEQNRGREYDEAGRALLKQKEDLEREMAALMVKRNEFEKKNTYWGRKAVSELNLQIAEKTKELGALEANLQTRQPAIMPTIDPMQFSTDRDARDEGTRFRGTAREKTPAPPKEDTAARLFMNKKPVFRTVSLPQSRPSDVQMNDVPMQGFDDDKFAQMSRDAEKLKATVSDIKMNPDGFTQAAGGMESLSGKANESRDRMAAVVAEVNKVGPAGVAAGQQAASGAAIMESSYMQAIARIKSEMASIGNAGPMGRFNTGRSTAGEE
jgi:TP901 family phage tail tape measure protein